MAEQMEEAEKEFKKIAEKYPLPEGWGGERWVDHQAKDGDTLGEN